MKNLHSRPALDPFFAYLSFTFNTQLDKIHRCRRNAFQASCKHRNQQRQQPKLTTQYQNWLVAMVDCYPIYSAEADRTILDLYLFIPSAGYTLYNSDDRHKSNHLPRSFSVYDLQVSATLTSKVLPLPVTSLGVPALVIEIYWPRSDGTS